MQKQIPQAREQDEVSAKEKNKQKEYEQSWREAKIACNAFDGNPKKEPDIAPFRLNLPQSLN
jgi:hypothetical protein